jgi:hypothetical protein
MIITDVITVRGSDTPSLLHKEPGLLDNVLEKETGFPGLLIFHVFILK